MIRATFVSLALLLTLEAGAQTIPTSTSRPQGPFKLIVTAFEGIVRARANENAPWLPVEVGMELFEGAEFRTAHKSIVQFVIPPDQTVRLDRLGTVKILEAKFRDGSYVTELGMKRGRLNYAVEAPEGEQHDTRVRTPAATLAVRGTEVSITDEPPFAPGATSLTGRAEFRDAKKQVSFGAKGAGKTQVNSDKDSSAELALSQSYVDPSISYARTPAEARLVQQVLSQGGVLSFDPVNSIPVIRGGTPPSINSILDNPPGNLTFVLRWTGNVDLNLTVAPIGFNEIITPIFPLNQSPTGGRTLFDHRGGSAAGGIEIVYWPTQTWPGHLPGTADDVDYIQSADQVSKSGSPGNVQIGVIAIDDAGNVVRQINGQNVSQSAAKTKPARPKQPDVTTSRRKNR